MKDLPDGFDEGVIVSSLAEHWGFVPEAAEYLPVGFGSYHWAVTDAGGERRFVTVDDLDTKPWLGTGRDAVCAGLRAAYATARALSEGGLRFVIAPLPTREGEPLIGAGRKHTVAVFPFIDGTPGRYGDGISPAERSALVRMLVELHRSAAPAAPSPGAASGRPALLGRDSLEAALHDLGRPWEGGPFSEPARAALAAHEAVVSRLLAEFDRLGAEVAAGDPVVTHGEPHAGNVIRTAEGLVLVDWDTVRIAPPERDLWMFAGDASDYLALYAELAGRDVDETAIDLYRLAWELGDLAAYVRLFRSPHRESEDTAKAWRGVTSFLAEPGRTPPASYAAWPVESREGRPW